MNKKELYDIVIFGNYTKDTIITTSGTRYLDGGGFNYGAHAARMLGLNVAAVTRLNKEDMRVVQKLQSIGIDVYPFFTPSSTHMVLDYPTSDPDDRILRSPASAGSFTPDQFYDLEAKAFLINGSIRGEIPLDVVEYLRKKDSILVADLQGFIRVVEPDFTLIHAPWPEKEKYLSMIDVLKTDAVEAESLTGEKDINKAAELISRLGPKEIVLTHRDGILVLANGEFHEARFHNKSLIGRSGRGDTCIASYMAKRLSEPPEIAIIWSAAVTSLKMEKEGPFLRSVPEVEAFIQLEYNRGLEF
ncbi:MAG: PfkB family carbohydrate kinase [Melioribacteraceae bacterium]|nr:PfkB family carbohydrate kinase [Melioribacteraceae bacterium]